ADPGTTEIGCVRASRRRGKSGRMTSTLYASEAAANVRKVTVGGVQRRAYGEFVESRSAEIARLVLRVIGPPCAPARSPARQPRRDPLRRQVDHRDTTPGSESPVTLARAAPLSSPCRSPRTG